MHKHQFKHNLFLVVSGELVIEVEKNAYKLIDTTVLGPGDVTNVIPNEHHRFLTREQPCTAYEVYYCEPLSADIVRRDVGSRLT